MSRKLAVIAAAASLLALTGCDSIREAAGLTKLPPDEFANVTQVLGSLEKVLESLEADNGYLQEGGVFTEDLISTWVDYKRTNEIDPVRLRPTPHEFAMYYDV